MNAEVCMPTDLHADAPAWLCRVRRFLRSPLFLLLLFGFFASCTAAFAYFDARDLLTPPLKFDVLGAFVGVVVVSLILILSDDVFDTTVPFLLFTVLVSSRYDSYGVFIEYAFMAIPFVAALIFHFVYYRGHFHIGKNFAPLLGVSLAVTLGGLGTISAKEYFNPATLYYVLGLGFGMLGLYCLLGAQRARKRTRDLKQLLLLGLYLAALYAVFFTLCFYAVRWVWMVDDLRIYGHLRLISIHQRNVYATFLLLGLPAPFYYAQKKGGWWHYGGALLIFLSLFLTGSRGGMLMGLLTLIACYVYALRRDRRHRVLLLAALGVGITGVLVALPALIKFFSFRFEGGFIKGDEPRVLLLQRAWGDFLSNPIFGTGIGYTGNADIYDPKKFAMNWYHMMIPQVVSGLGLLGVAAYSYLLGTRFSVMRRNKDSLSRALFLAYLGLLLMSQVNPGEFCPMPYTLIGVLIFLFLEDDVTPDGDCILNTPVARDTCALLSAGLWGNKPTLSAAPDFIKIYDLSQRHMIFGTVSEGLSLLDEGEVALPLLLEWQGKTVTLLRQNAELADMERELFAFLDAEGIPAAILKGSSVARLYPAPEMRVQGDIDCLVPPDKIDTVAGYLRAAGFEQSRKESDHQIVFTREKFKVELHFAVSGIPEGAVGERLRTLLADTVQTAHRVRMGDYEIATPDPVHQALILLLHMQQHMREGGLGLRQVGDLALFLGKELDEGSAERLLPMLEESGLMTFFSLLSLLCVRHLGLSPDRVPWAANADPRVADALIEDFLIGGNFGQGAEEFAGSAIITKERAGGGNALSLALRNVAAKCREAWPISQKHGILLVFLVPFWVIRRIVRPRDGRRVRPMRMLRSAARRGKLYDSLGLFEPK